MEGPTTAKFRILSSNSEPFMDREEAGRLLASELSEYRGQKAMVLGIPRYDCRPRDSPRTPG